MPPYANQQVGVDHLQAGSSAPEGYYYAAGPGPMGPPGPPPLPGGSSALLCGGAAPYNGYNYPPPPPQHVLMMDPYYPGAGPTTYAHQPPMEHNWNPALLPQNLPEPDADPNLTPKEHGEQPSGATAPGGWSSALSSRSEGSMTGTQPPAPVEPPQWQ